VKQYVAVEGRGHGHKVRLGGGPVAGPSIGGRNSLRVGEKRARLPALGEKFLASNNDAAGWGIFFLVRTGPGPKRGTGAAVKVETEWPVPSGPAMKGLTALGMGAWGEHPWNWVRIYFERRAVSPYGARQGTCGVPTSTDLRKKQGKKRTKKITVNISGPFLNKGKGGKNGSGQALSSRKPPKSILVGRGPKWKEAAGGKKFYTGSLPGSKGGGPYRCTGWGCNSTLGYQTGNPPSCIGNEKKLGN